MDTKDKRIQELEYLLVEAQERAAYAEMARDNAVVTREEILANAKRRSHVSGRMISDIKKLVAIAVELIPTAPLRAQVLESLERILSKDHRHEDLNRRQEPADRTSVRQVADKRHVLPDPPEH